LGEKSLQNEVDELEVNAVRDLLGEIPFSEWIEHG
jgi:hypothetical protein